MAFLEYAPRRTLFHYTTVAGFNGICASKQLWLTDLRETNDPRELQFGKNEVDAAWQFVIKHEFSGENRTYIQYLFEQFAKYMKIAGFYSCSFSHYGDVLPMWREYAANATGIAIGFRPTAITDMPLRVQKVNYLTERSQEELRNLIRELIKPFEGRGYFSLEDEIAVPVGLAMAVTAAKHQTWSYEEEVRGLHAKTTLQKYAQTMAKIPAYEYPDGKHFNSEINQTTKDGREITFIPLYFGKYINSEHQPDRAIEVVVIGPKCELTKAEVLRILKDSGYKDFEIRHSDCLVR